MDDVGHDRLVDCIRETVGRIPFPEVPDGRVSWTFDFPAPRPLGWALRIHHSEIEQITWVDPVVPPKALELRLPVSCQVNVTIDEHGVPGAIVVDSCPLVFHDPARAAVEQWRWDPYLYKGKPCLVRTLVKIDFDARQEP